MKNDDKVIQFVLSRHWEKVPIDEIQAKLKADLKKKLSMREIRQIIETYTARHHGEVTTREEMGLAAKIGC